MNYIKTYFAISFLIINILVISCTLPDAPEKLPTILTNEASNVDYTYAAISAVLKEKGCYCTNITQGFYISQDSSNILGGQKIDVLNSKIGQFGIVATGLLENKKYFVRSYAQNKVGLQIGNIISFVTKGYSLPIVETEAIDSVKYNSVFALGNAISDGGTKLLRKGFCISINKNPTVSDIVLNSQLVLGKYALVILNLLEGTKYYIKAFATNSKGVSYGKEVAFTTPDFLLPTVITKEVSSVANNTAIVTGEVILDGYTNVFERGFVFSTNPNPSISDFKKMEGNGVGLFQSSLENLIQGTKYYLKAYAINKKGISYGEEKSLVTNNVCNDLNKGLVAYFGFNGSSNDQGPYKFAGINFDANLTTDRYGNANSAYQFSSNNCSTRIESKLDTKSINGELTISIWALRSGDGCVAPRLFEFLSDIRNDGPGMAQWSWANDDYTNIGVVTSTGKFAYGKFNPVKFNNWTHLVYTNDGKIAKIYQDGKIISQFNSTGSITLGGNLAIGRMNHSAWDAFNGKLDDLGVWNRALCDEEIDNLFKNPFYPK